MGQLLRNPWFYVPALAGTLVFGAVWFLKESPEAREVLWTTGMYLFTFFATPFVLETTVAILGFLALLTWNQRRIQKEGDGWVYLDDSTGEIHEQLPPGAVTEKTKEKGSESP